MQEKGNILDLMKHNGESFSVSGSISDKFCFSPGSLKSWNIRGKPWCTMV